MWSLLALSAALRTPIHTPTRPLRTPTPALAAGTSASVLFVVGDGESPFGATSPEPSPSWATVAHHLARRLPDFDPKISASVATADALAGAPAADVVVALGVGADAAAPLAALSSSSAAVLTYRCGAAVRALQRVGAYEPEAGGLQEALTSVAPWAGLARGKRISEQAALLLSRHSSEDLLYAVFFAIHGCELLDLAIVRHTVNPTWEKGPVQNAVEFGKMCTKCGDKIAAALGAPETKATIDLLNACDMRDQVGSYRVIVSFETPQLEEFSLCILQQNNCFECSADILETPRVPLQRRWNGAALDAAAARQIFVGHLDHAEAHASSQKLAHSWKIVCGANPAYDAFPAQHQIFYPSTKSSTSLWYDPVFKVETLDGRQVWTKRHYRCTPREVAADLRGDDGASHGAWTLSTLDNGVISKEHWTTVDAADDLSWAIFHYSGAASVVGQSYLGALLCSADGRWPEGARSGAEYERIRAGFASCGIELWELYGHGPPGDDAPTSFMWTAEHARWQEANPPPLEPIGEQSVQAWRKSEKERALQAA